MNDTRVVHYLSFALKYTPVATDTGCSKDHSFPQTGFSTYLRFVSQRPVDTSSFYRIVSSTTNGGYGGNGGSAFLNWPGGNNNNVACYVSTLATVTDNDVVIPITYTKGSSGVYGFDFLAIPNRPGIIVDSVKDDVTGAKLATVANSGIYQCGYMAANSTRNMKVYTRVTLCANDTLYLYADRTPCSGYPASWAAYGCRNLAKVATYRYLTFQGELQMDDSLTSIQKDICVEDTVVFRVINSQTQTAYNIAVGFKLPLASSLVAGHTQLRRGNGGWVTISDPVYNGTTNTYNWTMPANDSLASVTTAPANTTLPPLRF